jgi:hypothetical protein
MCDVCAVLERVAVVEDDVGDLAGFERTKAVVDVQNFR